MAGHFIRWWVNSVSLIHSTAPASGADVIASDKPLYKYIRRISHNAFALYLIAYIEFWWFMCSVDVLLWQDLLILAH